MKRMFTKHFICCLFLILYMVLLCQTAIADMLTVADGHICGSITVQKGNMSQESITETFLIDCPEPENAFRPEIITTSKGYVSKIDMQNALAALVRVRMANSAINVGKPFSPETGIRKRVPRSAVKPPRRKQ